MIKSFITWSDTHWGISRASRKDDIHKILYESLEMILSFGRDKKVDMFFSNGDLFDSHNISTKKINEIIDLFKKYNIEPEEFSNIAGNHCLYKNTYELLDYSSLSLFNRIYPDIEHPEIAKWQFGTPVESITKDKKYVQIHQYVDNINYKTFFELFPNSKYILSGDNHQVQHYQYKGSNLLNPGHVVRNNRAEKEPFFFYVNQDNVQKIALPDTDTSVFNDSDKTLENLMEVEKVFINMESKFESKDEYLKYLKENINTDEYERFIKNDFINISKD